jgi:excisionase family DNA binding protein
MAQVQAEPRFLSADQLAKLLGVAEQSIHNARLRGELTYYKLGNRYMFKLDEVLEAIRRRDKASNDAGD